MANPNSRLLKHIKSEKISPVAKRQRNLRPPIVDHPGRTGWTRNFFPDSVPETDEELEEQEQDRHIARAIENRVFLPYGVQDTALTDPLEEKEMFRALWPLVHRGLSSEAGIKFRATEDALTQKPTRMKNGEKTFDDYQKQDIGQAARIEREMNVVMLLHDMGLGKTLQALGICEHNRDLSNNHGPTLIVVPPDAILDQWLKALKDDVPNARVWDYRDQKSEKRKTIEELEKYDYVVASFFTVSNEYEASRISALDQAFRQVGDEERTIPFTKKELDMADALGVELEPKTVEFKERMPDGFLHTILWHRVIMDEAHRLRRNGKMAHAMYALKSQKTMLLTGTPQQNDYLDWYALLNMAKLRAFQNNKGGFKSLFRNKSKNKDWQPLDIQRRLILSLIVRGISLRRKASTLFNGMPSAEEIPSEVFVRRLSPDNGTRYPHHLKYGSRKSEEVCQLDTIHNWNKFEPYINDEGLRAFRLNLVPQGKKAECSIEEHVFVQILRNRQAVINPLILVDAPEDMASDALEAISPTPNEVEDVDSASTRRKLSQKEKKRRRRNWCKWMKDGEKWRSSTTEQVVEIVREHLKRIPKDPKKRQKSKYMGPGGLIIFCEFIRGLDVIEMAIEAELGIQCLRRDGTVTGRKKREALEKFRAQASMNHMILLTTGRSGGEGLNLPEAATVIQTSPSFNPFLDLQAQCRPLRRGQTEIVHIYKLVMNDSYEQRIDFMQYRKKDNARGVLDDDEIDWQNKMAAYRAQLHDEAGFLAMAAKLYIKTRLPRAKKASNPSIEEVSGENDGSNNEDDQDEERKEDEEAAAEDEIDSIEHDIENIHRQVDAEEGFGDQDEDEY